MKSFYMNTQKFGDKFEVVCRDAHINAGGSYQTSEYRLVICAGQLENVVISHDDVPQVVLHFFDSANQGRMVAYKAMRGKNDLLVANKMVEPGMYTIEEYLKNFGSVFDVSHKYQDGTECSRFFFFPRNNTIMFSNAYTNDRMDPYRHADAIFKLDVEKGLVRSANLALRGDGEVLPIRGFTSLEEIEPKQPESAEENLKKTVELEKMAVLSALSNLTLSQQRDVWRAAAAKLDLYQNSLR
ncbi:MAG: hypothetical protein II942_00265 [Alphaproteobacteria bacterium]|nr:hypothetical protein [Alphaproteobacteria bacterium]